MLTILSFFTSSAYWCNKWECVNTRLLLKILGTINSKMCPLWTVLVTFFKLHIPPFNTACYLLISYSSITILLFNIPLFFSFSFSCLEPIKCFFFKTRTPVFPRREIPLSNTVIELVLCDLPLGNPILLDPFFQLLWHLELLFLPKCFKHLKATKNWQMGLYHHFPLLK